MIIATNVSVAQRLAFLTIISALEWLGKVFFYPTSVLANDKILQRVYLTELYQKIMFQI